MNQPDEHPDELFKKAMEVPPEIRGLEYMQMVNKMVMDAAFPERKKDADSGRTQD